METKSDEQMGLRFTKGAMCNRKEAQELFIAAPSLTFRDICGNRNRRATQLIRQAIYLGLRPYPRYTLDRPDEIHCSLPREQIVVLLYGHAALIRAVRWLLSADCCPLGMPDP